MNRPIARVVVPLALLAAVVGAVVLTRAWLDRRAKESAARVGVANIQEAVKAFKLSQGEFPPDLEALTRPPDGKAPPLKPDDLTDPWGRPYVYERDNLNPSTGTPRIYSRGADPDNPDDIIANW